MPRPRPGIRLTDAEREHAAQRLHEAHVDGRISLDELDQRLVVVYAARVVGDLGPALHDVPTDRERELLAGRDPGAPSAVVPSVSRPLLLEGRWTVPRRLRIVGSGDAPLHRVRPDLRTALVGQLDRVTAGSCRSMAAGDLDGARVTRAAPAVL